MSRHWLLISVAVAVPGAASPLFAAEITDVADAADSIHIGNYHHEDLFDLEIDDSYELVMENGKITREPINLAGRTSGCSDTTTRDCVPVDELRYTRNTSIYRIRGQVGLYHDLALTFGWSYVIDQSMKFRYASGVTPESSTIDSTDTTVGTLFRHDFKSFHKGSGATQLGVRFAPLSDERDESKPTWLLAINWTAPWTSSTYDPAVRATQSKPGSVGDGVNYLEFSTALSKRLGSFGSIGIDPNANRRGYLDPYVELAYVKPMPSAGKALDALVRTSARPFAQTPSHQAKLNAGFEVVPYEDLKNDRKLALDFGARSTLYTAGRNYSEVTDALGRVTYTDDYVYVAGQVAIYAQIASFFRLRVGVALGTNTPHFITNEEAGRDVNGDGRVTDPAYDSTSTDVVNPYYCGPGQAASCANGSFPYDLTGMRLRDEEHALLNAFASIVITL